MVLQNTQKLQNQLILLINSNMQSNELKNECIKLKIQIFKCFKIKFKFYEF